MLHSVTRVAMAQGMLMARFAMSEGYAMKYLADQAVLHQLTLVQLAERVIERVSAS
jgi:AmiR/NasT family two-component response regulator